MRTNASRNRQPKRGGISSPYVTNDDDGDDETNEYDQYEHDDDEFNEYHDIDEYNDNDILMMLLLMFRSRRITNHQKICDVSSPHLHPSCCAGANEQMVLATSVHR